MLKESGPSTSPEFRHALAAEAIAVFRLHPILFLRPLAVLAAVFVVLTPLLYEASTNLPPHLWEATSVPFGLAYAGALLVAGTNFASVGVRVGTTSLTVYADRMEFAGGAVRSWRMTEFLSEVTSVYLERSLSGRLLGFGTVRFETRGVARLVAPRIADAERLASLVQDLCEGLRPRLRSGGSDRSPTG